ACLQFERFHFDRLLTRRRGVERSIVSIDEQRPEGVFEGFLLRRARLAPKTPDGELRHRAEIKVRQYFFLRELPQYALVLVRADDGKDLVGGVFYHRVGRHFGGAGAEGEAQERGTEQTDQSIHGNLLMAG